MEFSCPWGEFTGKFESRNLSRDNLSREIGRTATLHAISGTFGIRRQARSYLQGMESPSEKGNPTGSHASTYLYIIPWRPVSLSPFCLPPPLLPLLRFVTDGRKHNKKRQQRILVLGHPSTRIGHRGRQRGDKGARATKACEADLKACCGVTSCPSLHRPLIPPPTRCVAARRR